MSSRRNFLDADNNIMERNLRFVQNDLEDNLNQYFGGSGSRGNSTAISAPPRDYKVVQPKPDDTRGYKRSTDLEERKEFLRKIGLARHEAYDLAKAVIFDVPYYQEKQIEWLHRMRDSTQVKKRIVDELQSSDYKYRGYTRGAKTGYVHESERDMPDIRPPKAPRKVEWNINSPVFDMATDTAVSMKSASEKGSTGKSQPSDEAKRLRSYKRSLRYIRQMSKIDPATLSQRDKRLLCKHKYHVKKYELFEEISPSNRPQPASTTGQSEIPLAGPSTSGGSVRGIKIENDQADKAEPRSNKSLSTTGQSEIHLAGPSTSGGSVRGIKIENDQADKAEPRSNKSLTTTVFSLSTRAGTATVGDDALKFGGKRQTSDETQVSNEKQPKSSAPELQAAVLDRSHPEGRLTKGRWLLIEEKILGALADALANSEDDSFTAFDGAHWYKGIKIVRCGNEKALGFLKRTIHNLEELWPEMNLDVVPHDQIAYHATVEVWVPPPIIGNEAILKLLKSQNKALGSDDWRLTMGRARDNGHGKDISLKVSTESLRLLRLSDGVVKFGLKHLKVVLPVEADQYSHISGAN